MPSNRKAKIKRIIGDKAKPKASMTMRKTAKLMPKPAKVTLRPVKITPNAAKVKPNAKKTMSDLSSQNLGDVLKVSLYEESSEQQKKKVGWPKGLKRGPRKNKLTSQPSEVKDSKLVVAKEAKKTLRPIVGKCSKRGRRRKLQNSSPAGSNKSRKVILYFQCDLMI